MQIFRRILLLLLLHSYTCEAFFLVVHRTSNIVRYERKSGGQGFGKTTDDRPSRGATEPTAPPPAMDETVLTSSASSLIPPPLEKEEAIDDTRSPEERAAQVLREKYGLRTLGEQQVAAQQQNRQQEEQAKWAALQKKAATQETFDLFRVIPGPVLKGIDVFLKAGTAVCTLLFVSAGVLVTVEAWGKASGQELPPDFDAFIVSTVEPNFTPGLLVLLSFSVSWGIFAALQLGSQGASYKEDN